MFVLKYVCIKICLFLIKNNKKTPPTDRPTSGRTPHGRSVGRSVGGVFFCLFWCFYWKTYIFKKAHIKKTSKLPQRETPNSFLIYWITLDAKRRRGIQDRIPGEERNGRIQEFYQEDRNPEEARRGIQERCSAEEPRRSSQEQQEAARSSQKQPGVARSSQKHSVRKMRFLKK